MKAPAGVVPGNKGHTNDFENDEWIGIGEWKTEPFRARICFLFLSFFFFILITAQSLLFHISANQACSISAITTIKKHHMFNYLKISYKRKESDK